MSELTTLERLFQKSKQGLFGVLFVMSHDTSENKYRAWFMVVFHALQVTVRYPAQFTVLSLRNSRTIRAEQRFTGLQLTKGATLPAFLNRR